MTRREAKWHRRFLDIAQVVASWSKDPNKQVGAVIVRQDRTVASFGYNGFPRGVNDDPVILADREEKNARIVHAEVNAVLNARERLDGHTLYVWPPGSGPTCDRCAGVVIQSGINRVVYEHTDVKSNWAQAHERAIDMYTQAGVVICRLR